MRRTRTAGFAAGMALAAGVAAAQQGAERRPVAQETLTPITIERQAAQVRREATVSRLGDIRSRPLLTPFGPATSPESRRRKEEGSSRRIQAPDQVIDLSRTAAPAQSAASITTAFRGIDIFEAGVFTPTDAFFAVPPDPNVAASPTRVIHTVNIAIRMFTRTGAQVQTLDLNDFFGTATPTSFERTLFDPKIIYDASGPRNRFYVVALETTAGSSLPRRSLIHLAVSRSASPANLNPANWCFYRFSGRRDQGTDLDSWADFPSIGAGADALVISTNQFTFDNFSFTVSAIRAIRKLPLSNNAASCPSPGLFTFTTTDFTVQPAQQLTHPSSFTGTTNPVYLTNTFLSSVPPKDYRVYRLRNVATSPTLSRTTVTGNFAYFVPPNVGQDNEAGFITTNDERMEEAAGVGNAFWATHATACGFPTGVVSCVRVIRVSVGQTAAGALRASITQQSTFGAPDDFLFEPGIAVNLDETVAVPFHYASPSRTHNNLSSWWVVKDFAAAQFQPFHAITTGACQQVVDRTGDYIGAETDPVDQRSFWLAGERAREIGQFGNACLWQTRIIRVQPAGAASVAAAGMGNTP